MNRRSDQEELRNVVTKFASWLRREGYLSYDPYDVWGTSYGLSARRLYYSSHWLGLPLVVPVLLLEIFSPRWRSLFVRKERFATADGQIALGFLNLHELTGDRSYLDEAGTLCEALIESSVAGYSGYCWGYPFDWQNSTALWRKNTPYVTTAPYCFEAFLKLYNETGNARYFEAAKSVAKFVYFDLHDSETSVDATAASYSPIDSSKVVNASAYRAFVLFEAIFHLGQTEYTDKAERNLNFVLQSQGEDGSWLYALESAGEAFIDHFHTCFVLKNLVKINRRLNDERIGAAVQAGYDYYRRNLFYDDGLPRYFALEPRREITRLEMYNVAEAITLGVLLKDEIPEAYERALDLAFRVGPEFQLPDGHFVTRVYRGGIQHKMAFLRWPQAQMFLALTNVLAAGADSPTREERGFCLDAAVNREEF